MEKMKSKQIIPIQIIPITALVIFLLLAISCTVQIPDSGTDRASGGGGISVADETGGTDASPTENLLKFETSQSLKKFSSVRELENFLDTASLNGQSYSSYNMVRGGVMTAMAESASLVKSAAADSIESSGAADYSATNIQAAGVDEADFVKNDGKYIYTLSQNTLVIVDAFPAEDAEIVSETKVDGNARNIFVNKDRLVVFADGNEEVYTVQRFDFVPRRTYVPLTHVYVYDISDRKKPMLLKDYNLKGYYFDSRMIGDYVYFISRENVYYYSGIIDVPVLREGSSIAVRPEIFYFDNPEANYNFNTVASFNVFDGDEVNAKTFMMGYANTIYVSEDNIYITYRKNLPYNYYKTHNEGRFYEVVLPLLPSDVQDKLTETKNDRGLDSYEKWDKISQVLNDMYNKMGQSEKNVLIGRIEVAIIDYEAKLVAERSKTILHRIGIDNGKIEYGAKGEVPGYLLNQFSMDEHENNLRVATTTEIWTRRDNVMYNNVFVLNSEMETIGKLEALAPDERIYSTRFIGDRLYMVTFKRVDPLLVIDLSNPLKPEVLGELKIPGFSDYLHPYDDDHIIGIGKETEGNEWGGISTKGVKLSLFDVSDVKNPKQLAKYEIGEKGTDSEALRDHKAFLFDKNKNILVIPVTEVKGKLEYDSKVGYYRQRYWQGAYVFGLTLEDGFEVKGKITHNENDEQDRYYWWDSPNVVRRSLYMDDVLYTVSASKIKANDLEDIGFEINQIGLPYTNPDYKYPIAYSDETVESVINI